MEIGILREIEDHPNAIKLHEVYNDSHSYYLVRIRVQPQSP